MGKIQRIGNYTVTTIEDVTEVENYDGYFPFKCDSEKQGIAVVHTNKDGKTKIDFIGHGLICDTSDEMVLGLIYMYIPGDIEGRSTIVIKDKNVRYSGLFRTSLDTIIQVNNYKIYYHSNEYMIETAEGEDKYIIGCNRFGVSIYYDCNGVVRKEEAIYADVESLFAMERFLEKVIDIGEENKKYIYDTVNIIREQYKEKYRRVTFEEIAGLRLGEKLRKYEFKNPEEEPDHYTLKNVSKEVLDKKSHCFSYAMLNITQLNIESLYYKSEIDNKNYIIHDKSGDFRVEQSRESGFIINKTKQFKCLAYHLLERMGILKNSGIRWISEGEEEEFNLSCIAYGRVDYWYTYNLINMHMN